MSPFELQVQSEALRRFRADLGFAVDPERYPRVWQSYLDDARAELAADYEVWVGGLREQVEEGE